MLCLNPDDTDHNDSKIWNNYLITDSLKDILPFIKDKI